MSVVILRSTLYSIAAASTQLALPSQQPDDFIAQLCTACQQLPVPGQTSPFSQQHSGLLGLIRGIAIPDPPPLATTSPAFAIGSHLAQMIMREAAPDTWLSATVQFANQVDDELAYALLRVGHVLAWRDEGRALRHVQGDDSASIANFAVGLTLALRMNTSEAADITVFSNLPPQYHAPAMLAIAIIAFHESIANNVKPSMHIADKHATIEQTIESLTKLI